MGVDVLIIYSCKRDRGDLGIHGQSACMLLAERKEMPSGQQNCQQGISEKRKENVRFGRVFLK